MLLTIFCMIGLLAWEDFSQEAKCVRSLLSEQCDAKTMGTLLRFQNKTESCTNKLALLRVGGGGVVLVLYLKMRASLLKNKIKEYLMSMVYMSR